MNRARASVPLRLGLAQFKPEKAAVSANLERIAAHAERAHGEADLLVFPEAATSGYFLEGGVAEAALDGEALVSQLGEAADGHPDLVLGFFERWRRTLYNSVAYLTPADGQYRIVHTHRKIFLPTYGVFDEARFVEPGRVVEAFDTRFGRVGMLVCEDAWHSLTGTILAADGAELIVVASASPARGFRPSDSGRPENLDRWDRLAPAMATEHGVFVAVSQLVGSEGGKLFPGGSVAFGPDGAVVARGPLFDEGVTIAPLALSEIDRVRAQTPLLSDLNQMMPHLRQSLAAAGVRRRSEGTDEGEQSASGPTRPVRSVEPNVPPGARPPSLDDPELLRIDPELVTRTLVEFIREEVCRRRGFERVVIGVSGGVDSALSLFLATKALGPENVYGFRLPYRASSQESLDHAEMALQATGAHARTIEISEAIDRYIETYEPDITPLRRGNLLARLRAVILFDQSARLRALPLGTGNKSERLLGYFTWHADDSPPINPLGDLFKTQVWELARHLGVPEIIVEKPATADLVKGVTDEDEIGISYHRADPILHALLAGYDPDGLQEAGFPTDEVELVARRLGSTHWKRELPTVAVLSDSAIGEFYLRPVDY